MKTILVATDFSHAARNAAKYAVEMALAVNAKVLLLHVYQIPVTYLEVPVLINEESIRNEAEANIKKLKGELDGKTAGKIIVETEVRMGTFFHELKELCREIEPYAVVLGSQGTTAAEHFFFGTHAVYTTKHLQWPVITVPQTARYAAVKKIGLACDFSKVVDTTPVEEISKLVKDFNAELHVLNTGKQTEFDPDVVFESGLLQEMIGKLKPNYHFITNEKIDESIMEFAEKNNIDLLVVLPKRHGLVDKMVHKSHTKQLVLHSHVPVMSLHTHTA
jgi:nucleotide-binding universal stress UspA family protein